MTTRTALFALLAVWGVGDCLPVLAQSAPGDEEAAVEQLESTPLKRSLTNRVWVRADGDLPGVIRVFLSDGTLISDSCWETHRLSAWRMTSDSTLSWNEDGTEIAAEVVRVTSSELILRLGLKGATIEERYAAADVPAVCPDMPA